MDSDLLLIIKAKVTVSELLEQDGEQANASTMKERASGLRRRFRRATEGNGRGSRATSDGSCDEEIGPLHVSGSPIVP